MSEKYVDTPSKPYAVGILYVHGIGEQRKGEAGAAFVDACCAWVRGRIDGMSDGHGNRHTTRETLEKAAPRAGRVPDIQASRGDLRQHTAFLKSVHDFVPEAKLTAQGAAVLPPIEGEPLLASFEIVAIAPLDQSAPQAFALELDWTAADGKQYASDWLLAESWWADKCLPPSIWQLLTWSGRAVPISIAAHQFSKLSRGKRVQNKWHRRWLVASGWLLTAVGPLLAIFLAPLIYLLIVMVGFLSSIPIGWVKDIAQDFRLLLTRVIGDAFILSESSAQHATILGTVQRDLNWLAERCESVLIVGHSQGAMLAYLACRRRPQNVRTLITLGSGIQKLRALGRVTQRYDPVISSAFAALTLANFAGMGVWVALSLGLTGQMVASNAILAGLVAAGIAAIVGLFGFATVTTAIVLRTPPEDHFWDIQTRGWESESARGLLGWADFIATRDVVPGISFATRTSLTHDLWDIAPVAPDDFTAGLVLCSPWPAEFSVTNTGSVLLDHTAYLENKQECVAAIIAQAALLDRGASQWLVPDADRARVLCADVDFFAPRAPPSAPICNARKYIFARASLASSLLTVVLLAFLVIRFADAFPANFLNLKWDRLWGALGLGWRDLIFVTVMISAWVGIRSARAYALQRLTLAVFERRNWCSDLVNDKLQLVDNGFQVYEQVSLGEGLGLAVSISIPVFVVLAFVQTIDEPTAMAWTLLSVAAAHLFALVLRLHENKVDLRRCYGRD